MNLKSITRRLLATRTRRTLVKQVVKQALMLLAATILWGITTGSVTTGAALGALSVAIIAYARFVRRDLTTKGRYVKLRKIPQGTASDLQGMPPVRHGRTTHSNLPTNL